MSILRTTIQPDYARIPPPYGGDAVTDGGASFGEILKAAVFESEGIISYDNFAAFTDQRTRSAQIAIPDGGTGAPGTSSSAPANRDRLGDTFAGTRLPVIWDEAGVQRLTPGGGHPEDIIGLIYELKALGIGNAERFWHGPDNGGVEHLAGFGLLNQLKLSVMRHDQKLLTPDEYKAIGKRMMEGGTELDLYPNGFEYGS